MRLRDYFVCTAVLGPGSRLSREALLSALLSRLAATGHLPRQAVPAIHAAVLRREELGSTAIGGGLAIPHARHPEVPRPVGALAVCRRPVDFDSLDGEPVEIVALCLGPPLQPGQHIGEAWFSEPLLRSFRDQVFWGILRRAASAEEIAALLWAREGGLTPRDWLACNDPVAMLGLLRASGGIAGRKARLFACACCRRHQPLLRDQRNRRAVETAERFADGRASAGELAEARAAVEQAAMWGGEGSIGPAWEAGWRLEPYAGALARADHPSAPARLALAAVQEEADDILALCLPWATALGLAQSVQANLLRDIVAHPDHRHAVDPGWRTPTVVTLARASYQESTVEPGPLDPTHLLILADALEEAGCTNAGILDHLRSAGPHARGCWAVDRILNLDGG